jgi:hypothetical protein
MGFSSKHGKKGARMKKLRPSFMRKNKICLGAFWWMQVNKKRYDPMQLVTGKAGVQKSISCLTYQREHKFLANTLH